MAKTLQQLQYELLDVNTKMKMVADIKTEMARNANSQERTDKNTNVGFPKMDAETARLQGLKDDIEAQIAALGG